jgi:uracil-DNA glycosylase
MKTSEKLKNYIEEVWLQKLTPFLDSKRMDVVLEYLKIKKNAGKIIFPAQKDIFNAFKYTPFDKVKVVILAQDPYPSPGLADGLAFSSGIPTTCPASLRNILKEVEDDVYRGLSLERTSDYSLKNWAEQGVLLINTALTVELLTPGSHVNLWNEFTINVINILNKEKDNLIFLLWGKDAAFFEVYIDVHKHYILQSTHPSPLARNAANPFHGCNHFSKTNLILEEKLKTTPIEW